MSTCDEVRSSVCLGGGSTSGGAPPAAAALTTVEERFLGLAGETTCWPEALDESFSRAGAGSEMLDRDAPELRSGLAIPPLGRLLVEPRRQVRSRDESCAELPPDWPPPRR